MRLWSKNLWSGNKRFRLLLTLELAVMLPAAALIYVNFNHLKSIERDKVLEAAINRNFEEMLAISEKKINHKAYTMLDDVRDNFPSPDGGTESDMKTRLDMVLSKSPWLSHVLIFDENGLLLRTQPQGTNDRNLCEEHEFLSKAFRGWLEVEAKLILEGLHKKSRPFLYDGFEVKRAGGYAFMTTALFSLPGLSHDRLVLGGASFEPDYLKQTFFPQMLEELVAWKSKDEGGNRLAMEVIPADNEGGHGEKVFAASVGWGEGKPEVSRNFGDVFRGLALGIKYQNTSAEALGRAWIQHSFLILGVLSLLLVAGLALTYRSVSKEVELARLKSDFVSNVSHELRTPLSLIRLYAETLELGRIKTQEKAEEYYRIVREESERLSALINNILDFSRIEAGRKEYDFRRTDIAELVSNTLDAYRFQIEQQGFVLEQSIDSNLPPVRVDREAIARSLVNLINNALKYSADDKFLGVRLYRSDGLIKLEVVDRGIGIARGEQSKIFEKFYRAGDPLVHNTKGSGLGLSLVRHIAHAHGGEVEVESAPGRGSKFTFFLPLETGTQETADELA
ncbi:MAG TPA: HAMP domain-containing sensor histidine kinase [Acidobacteriota bacterium]|nr:HAMP domain-containing sensor histidine kinase [Acidobacteriota bacterium]